VHGDPRRPEKAYSLTIKQNCVAVVTDGTAVLGLGDIGPGRPCRSWKARPSSSRSWPTSTPSRLCLATKDVDEIVMLVKAVSPVFGGINLEDISAPRCFEIEDRLKKELDIPVFHDDQHGTAVVVLAALINALKIVKKKMGDIRVRVHGRGGLRHRDRKLLMRYGVKQIVACDRAGVLYKGRKENMNSDEGVVRDPHEPQGPDGHGRRRARRRRRVSSASAGRASSA